MRERERERESGRETARRWDAYGLSLAPCQHLELKYCNSGAVFRDASADTEIGYRQSAY